MMIDRFNSHDRNPLHKTIKMQMAWSQVQPQIDDRRKHLTNQTAQTEHTSFNPTKDWTEKNLCLLVYTADRKSVLRCHNAITYPKNSQDNDEKMQNNLDFKGFNWILLNKLHLAWKPLPCQKSRACDGLSGKNFYSLQRSDASALGNPLNWLYGDIWY